MYGGCGQSIALSNLSRLTKCLLCVSDASSKRRCAWMNKDETRFESAVLRLLVYVGPLYFIIAFHCEHVFVFPHFFDLM